MEKINVFIVALPTFDSVVGKIKSAIEDTFENPKSKKPCFCCDEDDEDFTPKHLRVNKPCGNVQPWGIKGKKANENLRFGYGLEVDEPRKDEFYDWDEFLEAREAFDDFVTAGEHCRELGLEKTNNAPITKCNAIRKPIGCPPPMKDEIPCGELIGETHWWDEDFKWNF